MILELRIFVADLLRRYTPVAHPEYMNRVRDCIALKKSRSDARKQALDLRRLERCRRA